MVSFKEALAKYSSGDNLQGTDKDTTHSYGAAYENILNRLNLEKRTDVHILEIGVLSGAFLQVLHEVYPHAHLYGVDVNLDRYLYSRDNPRIHLHCADGTSKDTAASLNQRFDLVIEDASHTTVDQLKTLDAFAPYLKTNSCYVIEDINLKNNDKFKTELEATGHLHGLSMQWMDFRLTKDRYDDVMAIFVRE